MESLIYLSILLHCCVIPMIRCNTSPDVQSDTAQSLLSTLRLFAETRHHRTNPEGKQTARELIKTRFMDAGLHVWSEEVVLNKTLHGENIVGMLKGARTATADDAIVIVGAHYDTTEDTTGVNDNGSGVTALLEAAKQIGKAKPWPNNTILFVAFDFKENTPECNVARPISCGSWAFVKNLTKYLTSTKGTVNGALILETIINYNSSAGSQILPPGTDRAIPVAFQEIKNDSFRGNFLGVVGRTEGDKKLFALMEKYYEKDLNYRAQLMSIPLPSKQSTTLYFGDFYRSDHFRFWDNDVPYSALMLTDTADFRGYMKTCYHKTCDTIRYVKDEDLEFLRRTINAIIKTSLELSEAAPRDTNVSRSRYLMDLQLLLVAIIIAMKCGQPAFF